MRVVKTKLEGVVIIDPVVHGDNRGFFVETHRQDRYAEAGIAGPFVQDNMSRSSQGTLRGLHYQIRHPQGKLVSVVEGQITDVAVDLRRGSPTYGEHVLVPLDDKTRRQLFVPIGFAHGFCVISESAIVQYKCTDYYDANAERGVRWDDPTLAIRWPVRNPILSERDKNLPLLASAEPFEHGA